MIYNYAAPINIGEVDRLIRASTITIALVGVTQTNEVAIEFKAALSAGEKSTLDDIVANHNLNALATSSIMPVVVNTPVVLSPFSDSGGFRFRGASFLGTALANATTDIEYEIVQERFINGGKLIVPNRGAGDSITFQVVDKNNVLGFGANVVLDEFIKDFFLPESESLDIALAYPARVIAGLFLRLKYTNTTNTDLSVKCNLYLHWRAV